MNLNVAHIIIKIRERVKYYFADFVLHKNINIMFTVKSCWYYLNKKILPHLCECLDNASFDFSGHWHKLCRQPHFLFIFVTFFIQPQGQNLLLCAPLDLQKLSNLLRPDDFWLFDPGFEENFAFHTSKAAMHCQCNVFSQFKPDIKMTPCKTIFQLMTRRYKCTNKISGGCRQRKMQDQRFGLMMKCGAVLWYNIHVGGRRA